MSLMWTWGCSGLFHVLLRMIKELGSERVVTIFDSSGEITGLETLGMARGKLG